MFHQGEDCDGVEFLEEHLNGCSSRVIIVYIPASWISQNGYVEGS